MWTRVINRGPGDIDLFRSQLHKLINEFDSTYTRFGRQMVTSPFTNMYDNGDNFTLQAEVPGLAKEDIQIKIQGNYLEISGKRNTERPEGYKAHRIEQQKTAFTRSFTLPTEVNVGSVSAELGDGILTLTLPKAEAAKARQIEIH